VLRYEVELPRPRDLKLTYSPVFSETVQMLRSHIHHQKD